jgi:hypothetical protein
MDIDWELSKTILSGLNDLIPATRRDIDSGGLYNELKAQGVKFGLTAHYLLTIDHLVKAGFIDSAGSVGEEDEFPHPHYLMNGLTQAGKDKLKSLHN